MSGNTVITIVYSCSVCGYLYARNDADVPVICSHTGEVRLSDFTRREIQRLISVEPSHG